MEETSVATQTRRRPRIFYGWWVVAVASLQGMFGNGAISNGFSIFFQPIRQELGISYTAMSLLFSLGRAEGGMGGPIVGWLVDKFGSRPMIFFGGLLAGGGLILLSRAQEYWQILVIFVGIVSVGKTAGLGQTLMASVNQWFIRRRALAMSTIMTSFAGGGAIVVPLLGLGIGTIGWRASLLYTGIFICALTLVVSYVIRSKPEDIGLRPDGDEAIPSANRGQGESESVEVERNFTVRQAMRTSALWFLILGVLIRVSSTNAIIIHIFPMLEEEGLSTERAAFFVSAMFFLAIPLRFGMGVTSDYIPPRLMMFIGMMSGAIGLGGLIFVNGTSGIIIFILGLTIIEGITSVNWLMVSDYFGRSRFASIMGLMSIFHNVGMVISPIFSGWVRDTTGSYDIVMLTFAPLFILGGLAFLLARRPALPTTSSIT